MRRRGLVAAFACAVMAVAGPAFGAGKAEAIGPYAGPGSDLVKAALEAAGHRVTLSDGSVACELWLRTDVPALSTSIFVGVISFPKAASDFRGQPIKAGAYTLRYAQMPGDGNHLGAAPTTDFLLLIPAAEDADPAAQFGFEQLVKLSKKASGTNHPAPLNLAATDSQKEFATVVTNNEGHEVFFVKARSGGAELPLGLVVKGRTDH